MSGYFSFYRSDQLYHLLVCFETELFEMKAEREGFEPFYRNRELPPAGYWIKIRSILFTARENQRYAGEPSEKWTYSRGR